MIGELGLARDAFDGLPTGGVAARMESALQALRKERPEYVVFWQALDAPPGRSELFGFGLLELNHQTPEPLLRFLSSYR